MKAINIVYSVIFLFIIGIIFRNWFLFPQVIGGDWPYYFNEMLKEFPFFPLAWNPGGGNGLGGVEQIYFLSIFHNFTTSLNIFIGLPWAVIYKIFWFGLFIISSIYSSISLLRVSFPEVKYWQQLIGAVIFVSNTYILMVAGGGQMGVALAYSVAPLVLANFIKIIQNFNFRIKNSLVTGLVLATQVLFDPRIAYITMIAVGLYLILSVRFSKENIFNTLNMLFCAVAIPLGVTILLHASWIAPMLFFRQNPLGDLGQSYTGVGIVKFLSFANFSDALAFLHPNWPENLFGKVYFMRPEFLMLPILAYSSLFFIEKIQAKNQYYNNKLIVFFALLGLLGVFLAKGANDPLGYLYIWMFNHFPGFTLFRDPTKFYLLIAISYSILMPFSLEKILEKILRFCNKSFHANINNIYYTIPAGFLIFWLFLIRLAVLGQLSGTFQKHEVPKEYFLLKDFLHNQPKFFRTLWVPRRVRFNYFSNNHSAIEFEPLFGTRDVNLISQKLHSEKIREYIEALGVKYVIVPFDPLGDVFVKDRKYDDKQYEDTIMQLDKIPWLTKLNNFGRIAVFETKSAKDHFTLSKGGKISYKMNSPVDYAVKVEAQEPQYLVFSENYNSSWVATSNNFMSIAGRTSLGFNSFFLPAGKYNVEITFSQQKYYEYGQVISIITFLCIIYSIFALQKKKV